MDRSRLIFKQNSPPSCIFFHLCDYYLFKNRNGVTFIRDFTIIWQCRVEQQCKTHSNSLFSYVSISFCFAGGCFFSSSKDSKGHLNSFLAETCNTHFQVLAVGSCISCFGAFKEEEEERSVAVSKFVA